MLEWIRKWNKQTEEKITGRWVEQALTFLHIILDICNNLQTTNFLQILIFLRVMCT